MPSDGGFLLLYAWAWRCGIIQIHTANYLQHADKHDFGGILVKIMTNNAEFVISDWNNKLKIATIILGVITAIASVILFFTKIFIPGLIPISLGCTTLLLGVKAFNVYFKDQKNKLFLVIGVTLTLVFASGLCIGINQIIPEILKVILSLFNN